MDITLRVNGETHRVSVAPRRLLLDCLRYDLDITGPKEGCSVGVCGACTVLIDGRPASACLEFAARCDGSDILTVEGLANGDELHPIQQAFIDKGGFQCGICTPGMVLAAKALLDEHPHPDEDDIKAHMMGNLCRCTGYYKIVDSIQEAARRLSGDSAKQSGDRS